MTLSLTPLAETFAAEVRGVDLRRLPSPGIIDEIYDAFLEHRVIVLPGQAIDLDQQMAFAKTFGEVWTLPEWSNKYWPRYPAIDRVSNVDETGAIMPMSDERQQFQKANAAWHSDLQSRPRASQASMLHALTIAAQGGETEFADTTAAYDSLPPARKTALADLIVEHSFAHSRRDEQAQLTIDDFDARVRPCLHPLVRTHPETGRKSLFIGNYARRVVGLSQADGDSLLEELTAFATQGQFLYRHRWAVHDLVIWDNRSTLHRALPFRGEATSRIMHRATTLGDTVTVADGKITPVEARRRPRHELID